jgi:hypothetical protein
LEQIENVEKKNWTNYTVKSLAFWVVVAIIAGIIFGMVDPKLAVQAKPGIDWFIQGLKWLVGPIIFLTIISGIVGLKSLKEVGSIGFKAFIYFEIVSTFALAIGVIFGNWFAPGTGMNLSVESLDAKSVEKFTNANQDVGSVWAILKGAIPSDPITPFINGQTLQVLVMALTLAVLISAFGGAYKEKILKPLEIAQNFFFKILTVLMWLSPIASFSAMSFLIGKFGVELGEVGTTCSHRKSCCQITCLVVELLHSNTVKDVINHILELESCLHNVVPVSTLELVRNAHLELAANLLFLQDRVELIVRFFRCTLADETVTGHGADEVKAGRNQEAMPLLRRVHRLNLTGGCYFFRLPLLVLAETHVGR